MQGSAITIVALALVSVVSVGFSSTIDKGTAQEKTSRLLSKIFQLRNKHFNEDYAANDITDNKLINETIIQFAENSNTTLENSQENLITVQKKSEVNATPWVCNSDDRWIDLGYAHYPRFVKEVTCTSTSCMDGFYICKQRRYPIQVLSQRQTGEGIEYSLPRNLRQDWKFNEIDISVGCYCGN